MERYSARPEPRRGQGALAASILIHVLALLLFWLLPKPDAGPDIAQALTIVDPPPVLVELAETVEPPETEPPEAPPAANSKGGGGSEGLLDLSGAAKAVTPTPDITSAPSKPIAQTVEPPSVEAGPAIADTFLPGGSGTGTGTGVGAGLGAGSGPGSGTGTAAKGVQGLLQMADWLVRPTDADMQKANPFLAQRRGVSGTVLLSCQVTDANRAKTCKTIKETPRGYGFAVAAKNVVRRGLIRPPVAGKRNPEDRVFVSITFENLIVGDDEG